MVAIMILSTAFAPISERPILLHGLAKTSDPLKKETLQILENKCNICHRKKNPFMVFNEKNAPKRAKKIYQMVFVERKMPKGNEVRLTNEEYIKLEKWLFTQNIF